MRILKHQPRPPVSLNPGRRVEDCALFWLWARAALPGTHAVSVLHPQVYPLEQACCVVNFACSVSMQNRMLSRVLWCRSTPNLTRLVAASMGTSAFWTEDGHVRGETEVCTSTSCSPGYISQPPPRVLSSLAYKLKSRDSERDILCPANLDSSVLLRMHLSWRWLAGIWRVGLPSCRWGVLQRVGLSSSQRERRAELCSVAGT